MKGILRRLAVTALALALLLNLAVADVHTTGDVNLRMGAGLEFDVFNSVPSGTSLPYLGQTEVDDRGVEWYLVDYNGGPYWISSVYSVLDDEDRANQGIPAYDPEAAKSYVEVSTYYLEDLQKSAEELELTNYREVVSEAPNQYSNDALTFGGFDTVEYMGLRGAGYTLFGAAVGMDIESAGAAMKAAGLQRTEGPDDSRVIFEHPSDERSYVDIEGFDSCVNVDCVGGIVTRMEWLSYTG